MQAILKYAQISTPSFFIIFNLVLYIISLFTQPNVPTPVPRPPSDPSLSRLHPTANINFPPSLSPPALPLPSLAMPASGACTLVHSAASFLSRPRRCLHSTAPAPFTFDLYFPFTLSKSILLNVSMWACGHNYKPVHPFTRSPVHIYEGEGVNSNRLLLSRVGLTYLLAIVRHSLPSYSPMRLIAPVYRPSS